MTFKGKTGLLLWLTLALDLGFAGWFWTLRDGFEGPAVFWGFMALYAAVGVLVLLFMLRNSVTVTDTRIRVRLGLTDTVLELGSVLSMKKTSSLLASSGASARRVQIVYRKNGVRQVLYVSPADRDGFIDAVLARRPDIKVYGQAGEEKR